MKTLPRNNTTLTCQNRHRAFTIVELLVVISVLSLLMALLLPALSQAVESSRRTKCLANLRGIGQGYGMYCNDNKGRTWTSTQTGGPTTTIDPWDATNTLHMGYTVSPTHPSPSLWVNDGKLIESYYIENSDCFGCPSAPAMSQTSTLNYVSLPILNIGRPVASRYYLTSNPPTYWYSDYYPRLNKDLDMPNNPYGNPLNFDRDANKGILSDNFRIGSGDNTLITGRPFHVSGPINAVFNATTHLMQPSSFGFNVLYLSGDARFTSTAPGITNTNSGVYRTWYMNYIDRK